MKQHRLACAITLTLLFTGCSTTTTRPGEATLRDTVTQAGVGAPRLPIAGENYLDAEWFKQPLTVERAVQAALLNNPRVRSELSRLDAAQAERVQTGLLRNPMASLMALRPDGGGRYELDYSLMQNLFDLFTRSRRVAVADAAQRRIEADVAMQLVAVAQDTEAAWYELQVAEQTLRVQQQLEDLASEQLTLIQRNAQQGALPASAVLEQQATASKRSHEVRMTEAVALQARALLAQQLGLASASGITLPENIPPVVLSALDETSLHALAMQHRADLQAALANVDQARAERELQTGALRATEPSLGVAGTRESGGLNLVGPSLQISLPIFDTGRARRDLANAQVAQAEFNADSVRRQVPLDIERALGTLIFAQLGLDHAEHHLHQQELLERLTEHSYRQGASDLLTYRMATQARLQSTLERIQAQQSQWAAVVALERATGVAASVAGHAIITQ